MKQIEIYSMAQGSHTLEVRGVDIVPTLTARCGTGGNQVPVLVDVDVILARGCLDADERYPKN